MADIFPFQGLRYSKKKVKDINKVFAPPYDIISDSEQKKLYSKHPFNVVRLILGKIKDSDNEKDNRYTRASAFLDKWINDGVLAYDEAPSIYLYAQDYKIDGVSKKRIGFISKIKFDEKGGCLPHEHTLVKPKEDRIALMRAVYANLSPIFSFYIDPKKKVENTLTPFMKQPPLFNFIDEEKIRHCFWKIDDKAAISRVMRLMKAKQVFIADGHHRYEVALAFRNEMRMRKQEKDKDKYNHVMMFFTGFNDENLSVLPTHRLIKDIPELGEKVKMLDKYFKITKMNNMKTLFSAQKNTFGFSLGMYYKKEFFLLKMKDKVLLNRLMLKSPAQWRRLDVAMLNKVVLEHIFELDDAQKEEKVGYTRDAQFAVDSVNKKNYMIAFFPNATKPEQVKKIALSRHKMPQKSTYFYPKPVSGLVINKF